MVYKDLKDWRNRTKKRLISGFNNKCGICDYSQCLDALEFHHLDPTQKEFTISSWKLCNWEELVKEIKKCVLLCCRCHREVHANFISVPNDIQLFDETISISYCNKNKTKIDYTELYDLYFTQKISAINIAVLLNVTSNTVHKHLRLLKSGTH